MDSHRPGLDGVRFCGGALRTVSPTDSILATHPCVRIVRSVPVVRHSTDGGWGRRECCRRVELHPIGPGIGSRPDISFPPLDILVTELPKMPTEKSRQIGAHRLRRRTLSSSITIEKPSNLRGI